MSNGSLDLNVLIHEFLFSTLIGNILNWSPDWFIIVSLGSCWPKRRYIFQNIRSLRSRHFLWYGNKIIISIFRYLINNFEVGWLRKKVRSTICADCNIQCGTHFISNARIYPKIIHYKKFSNKDLFNYIIMIAP